MKIDICDCEMEVYGREAFVLVWYLKTNGDGFIDLLLGFWLIMELGFWLIVELGFLFANRVG